MHARFLHVGRDAFEFRQHAGHIDAFIVRDVDGPAERASDLQRLRPQHAKRQFIGGKLEADRGAGVRADERRLHTKLLLSKTEVCARRPASWSRPTLAEALIYS